MLGGEVGASTDRCAKGDGKLPLAAEHVTDLGRLVDDLIQRQELTQSQFDAVEAEVLREIESAVEFARASPFPEPQAALQDVYAE